MKTTTRETSKLTSKDIQLLFCAGEGNLKIAKGKGAAAKRLQTAGYVVIQDDELRTTMRGRCLITRIVESVNSSTPGIL